MFSSIYSALTSVQSRASSRSRELQPKITLTTPLVVNCPRFPEKRHDSSTKMKHNHKTFTSGRVKEKLKESSPKTCTTLLNTETTHDWNPRTCTARVAPMTVYVQIPRRLRLFIPFTSAIIFMPISVRQSQCPTSSSVKFVDLLVNSPTPLSHIFVDATHSVVILSTGR